MIAMCASKEGRGLNTRAHSSCSGYRVLFGSLLSLDSSSLYWLAWGFEAQ